MARLAGMKLRCRDGHFGWSGWEIRPRSHGFVATVPCDLGDHYLVYAGVNAASSTMEMIYPTRLQAELAVAAWEQQEAGEE